MKSVYNSHDKDTLDFKYPCLLENQYKAVVLAYNQTTATLVYAAAARSTDSLGFQSTTFDANDPNMNWQLVRGSIVLSNS